MQAHRLVAAICALGVIALAHEAAQGQSFPSRPVRIVTSQPGGGTDFAARVIAQELLEPLGQVIVENRPNGPITIETVTKAAPDGHTLLQFMQERVSWDPLRDLLPVTMAMRAPNVLVVHPSLPVKSVQDLVALAKRQPGQLNYGTAGAGGHYPGALGTAARPADDRSVRTARLRIRDSVRRVRAGEDT